MLNSISAEVHIQVIIFFVNKWFISNVRIIRFELRSLTPIPLHPILLLRFAVPHTQKPGILGVSALPTKKETYNAYHQLRCSTFDSATTDWLSLYLYLFYKDKENAQLGLHPINYPFWKGHIWSSNWYTYICINNTKLSFVLLMNITIHLMFCDLSFYLMLERCDITRVRMMCVEGNASINLIPNDVT